MEIIKTLLWVIQITSAIAVVVLVLLQHGKGADAGATFGSSGSSSLFGASGSANFLSRTTAMLATIFFVVTLALVIVSSKGRIGELGVIANIDTSSAKSAASATLSASQPISIKAESGTQIPD